MEPVGQARLRGVVPAARRSDRPPALLGVVALTMRLTGDAFDTWGWRIPFLISFVLVLIGLVIRLKVEETPEFRRMVSSGRIRRAPVSEVLRHHPREIALTALMRLAEQTPFYLFTAFVLSYGVDQLGMRRELLVMGTLVAAALALLTCRSSAGCPTGSGASASTSRGGPHGRDGAAVLLAARQRGPGGGLRDDRALADPARHDVRPTGRLIAEAFAPEVRYSGSSLGYQLASVVAGGPAPLIAAWLLHTFESGYAIAGYIIVSELITIVATILLRSDPTPSPPRTSRS